MESREYRKVLNIVAELERNDISLDARLKQCEAENKKLRGRLDQMKYKDTESSTESGEVLNNPMFKVG
jgi:predicted RNase H-like nuclease (RuvC/YqgF family)